VENSTSKQIIDLAITQFMTYGVKSVSMDDLATQLGMSKKTLYKFFDGKQELIDSCISDYLRQEEQLLKHLEQTSTDAVEDMIRISQHFMNNFRSMQTGVIYELQKYYRTVWQKVIDWESEFIKQRISDNLKRGISEGLYRANIDPEIVSDLYVQHTYQIISNIRKYEKLGIDKTLHQHLLYHLHGILSIAGITHLKQLNLIPRTKDYEAV
jgi:AcrR family transcriptional regulator